MITAAAGVSPRNTPRSARGFPAAEPPHLDEAFALAGANNRTITAARLRRAIDQAGIDVAKERPNPT